MAKRAEKLFRSVPPMAILMAAFVAAWPLIRSLNGEGGWLVGAGIAPACLAAAAGILCLGSIFNGSGFLDRRWDRLPLARGLFLAAAAVFVIAKLGLPSVWPLFADLGSAPIRTVVTTVGLVGLAQLCAGLKAKADQALAYQLDSEAIL